MSRWTFTVALPTPLLNVTSRTHWRKLKQEKERWFWLLRAATTSVPKADGPRRMVVTRYSPGTPDFTNLVGGAKEVLEDNLRRSRPAKGKSPAWPGLGLIVDDSPEWLESKFLSVVCPQGQARTEVLLLDLARLRCGACGHLQLVYDEGCALCAAHSWEKP